MDRTSGNLDRRVRTLIQSVEPDLRRHLKVERLDRELVSDLYLRLRAVLATVCPEGDEAAVSWLVECLALTTYLVIVARSEGVEAPPGLLVSLRRSIGQLLDQIREAPVPKPEPGGNS